ncbi:MAG TPA: hypothetical protein VMV49_12420 [Candidatus Deferrimicrobium sp.]|nr:hypothetical protein [Candidatus Deferrimicrobium sp.]
MDLERNKEVEIVQVVIFWKLGQYGADPISYYPTDLDEQAIQNIGIKLLSVMAGEDELISEGIFVIPFPRFKFTGLNYSFIVDESAFFLTLMIKDNFPEFIFQNIDHLTDKLKATSKILNQQDFRPREAKIQMIRLYKYFIEFSKKYLEIRDSLLLETENTILTASLLYFHRKAGPIVYRSYPENILSEDQSKKLCKELEIATREGFFSRSYPDISHVSYYFEIPSDWARGKKEMLLLSFVFRKLPMKDITNALHLKSVKFVEKMQVHPEIFKGFYNSYEIEGYPPEEQEKAAQMSELLKQWIRSLYLASLDVFQSTSFENMTKE